MSNKTIILGVLIIVVLAGVAWLSETKILAPGPATKYTGAGADMVVLTVNGDPVTYGEVMDAALDPSKKSSGGNLFAIAQTHAEALDDVITKKLTDKALSSSGLVVNDEYLHSVAADISSVQVEMMRQQAEQEYEKKLQTAKPDELKKLKKPEQSLREALATAMQQHGGGDATEVSPEAFQSWFANDYVLNSDNKEKFTDNVRVTLLGTQVLKSLTPVDPLSEAYVRKLNTQEVRGRYIFVAALANTADALKAARDGAYAAYNMVLKDPKNFAHIAETHSSDFSGHIGGDLQWVKGGTRYVAPMTEYLLFALQPGEMSKPVFIAAQSPYGGGMQVGYGFVLVDQVRDRTPQDLKDFNWNRDQKMLMLKTRQQYSGMFGDAYQHFLRAYATILSKRHEMQAYLYDLDRNAPKANQEREASVNSDPNLADDVRASFGLVLGNVTPDLQKRADYYLTALPYAGAQEPQLHMKIGDTYAALKDQDAKQHNTDKVLKDTQNAIEQYADALSDAKITGDYASITQIQQVYKTLGNTTGVAEIADWLQKNPKPAQKSGPGGMPGGN